MDFVELDRTFVALEAGKEPVEWFGRVRWFDYGRTFVWGELLERRRVVVLAEAGSGKSGEFRERERRLRAENRSAFYLSVNDLHEHGVEGSLDPTQCRLFRAWLGSEHEGWIFIDSVDEARLQRREFDRALRRLAREIEPALARAHVLVSCRVSDWRGRPDRDSLRSRLPVPHPATDAPVPAAGDPLLDPLFDPEALPPRRPPPGSGREADRDTPLVVRLAPLDEGQIGRFARAAGIADSARFLEDLLRSRLEPLAERPRDLLDLIDYWRAHGRFGTLVKMIDHAVRKKLAETDVYRPDTDALTLEQSVATAERLAAAMTLGQTLTVRAPAQVPDPTLSPDALDPGEVLEDLTSAEGAALLRRGLFAPATYGRIRFHHRFTQDYLAALWLGRLLGRGAGSEVRDLLFATRHRVDVVVPSLRATAAWLALWHPDIRDEVLRRDPFALVQEGDPASLPVEARARALRALAGLHRDHAIEEPWLDERAIRPFTDERLADTVRDLWVAYPDPDFQELLLRLVEAGPMRACADLARTAVLDRARDKAARIFALRALNACADGSGLDTVAEAIRIDPCGFPPRLAAECIAMLFPGRLSVEDALAMVPEAPPRGRRDGLRAIARALAAKSGDLDPDTRERLMVGFAVLNRAAPRDFAVHFGPVLRDVLDALGDGDPSPGVLDACALWQRSDGRHEGPSPVELVRARPRLNRASMWHDVEAERGRRPAAEIVRVSQARPWPRQLWGLGPGDVAWLSRDARERERLDDRRLALSALVAILREAGTLEARLEDLRALARGAPELEDDLEGLLAPPKTTDAGAVPPEELRRREREQEDQAKAKAFWKALAERLRLDPASLTDEHRLRAGEWHDLFWLRHWLEWRIGREPLTDWTLLGPAFGPGVAAAYAAALRRMWRLHAPGRPERAPGGFPPARAAMFALDGLAIEAATPLWHERLDSAEVERAARHACVSGLVPDWLGPLAVARPDLVGPLLAAEFGREWAGPDTAGERDVIRFVAGASADLAPLVRKALLESVARRPSAPELLGFAATIVARLDLAPADAERLRSAAVTELERSRAEGDHEFAFGYLTLLFAAAPLDAAAAVERWIGSAPDGERDGLAARVFSDLSERMSPLDGLEASARVDVLERLLRLAHRYVRHADDVPHEGAYTPGTRDHAEEVRGNLLEALRRIPGSRANTALRSLASELERASGGRWMHRVAHRHAVEDSERSPMTPGQVLRLERDHFLPVATGDDLFRLVERVLAEVAAGLARDDASSRAALAAAPNEAAVQGWLAEQLNLRANERYRARRETEVADGNRPDITVASTEAQVEVAIELKRDISSVTELEIGLEKQLAADYLRPPDRRHGFFVIVHQSKFRWQRPEGGERIGFNEVIARLSALASSLTANGEGPIRVKVVGIDARPDGDAPAPQRRPGVT